MNEIIHLLRQHGAPIVFLFIFLEQIGAPVPAIPVVIVAAAFTNRDPQALLHLLVLSVIASLLADSIWFYLGRRYGYRIIARLCRISLSPDSCVRRTETFFEKWGMPSLTFAKFIPGLSQVAPPLAGAAPRGRFRAFVLYDTIGAALWIAAGIILGVMFQHAIGEVIDKLETLGGWAVVVLASMLLLFLTYKWWERNRFHKQLRMSRISVGELRERLESGSATVILDVRSESARRAQPGRIPGAIVLTAEEMEEKLEEISRDDDVVLYCT